MLSTVDRRHAERPATEPAAVARSTATVAARFERAVGFTPLFWASVAGVSLLAMMLLAGRVRVTAQSGHLSLVWDVFLAWVPVVPAVLIYRLSRRERLPRVRVAGLGLFWLLFFPNSPYLVTQLIHLHREYGPSHRAVPRLISWVVPAGAVPKPPPGWYEFLLLTTIAAAGLLLTLASLRLIERSIARRAGRAAAVPASIWLLVLAAFGVAVGRFTRLNSWDVFRRPVETADRIGTWLDETRFAGSAFVMAALFVMVYVAIVQSARPEAGEIRSPNDE
jgi:uncharacterized membrane protein